MSQLEYGFEKFNRAIYVLSASKASIKDRLFSATHHLGSLTEKNVPEEFRGEFNKLYKRITSGTPQSREGSLRATIDQISDDEAVKIIEEIVGLNENLTFWRGKNWAIYWNL